MEDVPVNTALPSQADRIKRLRDEMEEHFATPKEREAPASTQPTLPSDKTDVPTLRLHDYKREPKKRVIAQMLWDRQNGRCALESGGAVCVGYMEIDHADGDCDNWDAKNLRGLCETHNRSEENRLRAEAKRRSAALCVKNSPPDSRVGTPALRSVSLENEKHENYEARFVVAAPAYFKLREKDAIKDGTNPADIIVSVRSFVRAMTAACAYTDEAGREHRPVDVTIKRYIDGRIYPDAPDGWFQYALTSSLEDGLQWVGFMPKPSVKPDISAILERRHG